MQFSKSWLQEFFDSSLDAIDLAQTLTIAGIEVEDIQDLSGLSDQIVVGEIVAMEKHPDADRLNVCQVDVGANDLLQIVCGAPNARIGIKIPCAMVGAKLPGFDIKKAKLRGVESFGMLCSAKELGLSQEADGLYELGSSLVLGQTIIDALALNDSIYHLSITPNRADCLSIKGIAREVAALSDLTLKNKDTVQNLQYKKNNTQKVVIEDPVLCPRYVGMLIQGVDNKKKLPEFITHYLERGGISSINPVVDITNYVLLETGQPLHAFDHDKIDGNIRVRKALNGEVLLTINQLEIVFDGGELIIADNSGPLALAGIMGGHLSSTQEGSTNIFLESAYFDPAAISGRARSFGLNTDSSHRFERGVDFGYTRNAAEYAAALIMQYCGGRIEESADITGSLPERPAITLRVKKVTDVMGVRISDIEIKIILEKLRFEFTYDESIFTVIPPTYRFDMSIEEDLVEEIIRLYGYDNIPALAPSTEAKILPVDSQKKDVKTIKNALANLGYNEVISYSFIGKDVEIGLHGNTTPIALKNPIASHLDVMRSHLWGSHLEVLVYNLNRNQKNVKIFEVASVYAKHKGDYTEAKILSGLVYGDHLPEQWSEKIREINYYDIKGDIETISSNTLSFRKPATDLPAAFHPGKVAEVMLSNTRIGWVGQLHPSWQQKYELPRKAYLFEIDIEKVAEVKGVSYTIPSKFIPIRRDISLVMNKDVVVGEAIESVYAKQIPGLIELQAFDIYEGEGIEKGKKSIAFLILIQDTYKTLEDSDIANVVDQVIKVMESNYEAKLR